MKVRICIIICILLRIPLFQAAADDGSWSRSFSINGGGIYAEEEDPYITLAKELLIFDGEKTTAVFLFKNNASEQIKVTCGFPVKIHIDTYQEDEGYLNIPMGKYARDTAVAGLSYFETIEVEKKGPSYEPDFSHRKKILINEANNRREFLGSQVRPDSVEFSIRQEGTPVTIDDVLVERHADREGAWITFHYKHELFFPPRGTSTVVVEYSYDMFRGSYGAGFNSYFRWDYIIGTGSTWKGPIEHFYLARPAAWRGDTGKLSSLFVGETFQLSYSRRYEPQREASFALSSDPQPFYQALQQFKKLEDLCFNRPREISLASGPAQPFVKEISSSGALNQQVSVFTQKGIIWGAGFGPESAFDGIPQTAWCENAPGPGTGEYLGFTLTEPIWGLKIQNGFNRLLYPDTLFESGAFDREIRDPSRGLKDYYTLNNRVKLLDVTDGTGKVLYTLQLDDTRLPQTFPGITLPPGEYRAVIRDVYRGSAWQDTCLGEITFLTGSEAFTEDPFVMENLAGHRF